MKFPKIMGVVNVTPDSFSDGGKYHSANHAITHAIQLIDEGADILDIGGESTRPGSDSVTCQEELFRVLPVIKGIRKYHSTIPISIDTMKARVAKEAIESGATIVNDVSAGVFDEQMLSTVAMAQVPIIIMHMLGNPKTMQENPDYYNVVDVVSDYLKKRIEVARSFGIKSIMADVGIGFGKTLEHNLILLRQHSEFATLKVPLVLGISRKRFIGAITGIENAADRDTATAFIHALLINAKADIIRVHNVALIKQLRTVAEAVM